MWKSIEKLSNHRLALIAAGAIFCGVLIFFLPVGLSGIKQVVVQGETRYTEQEVVRAENIIRHDITQLDQILLDWSAWDATYQFVQDRNAYYIENDLADETVSNVGVDVLLVVNASGEVIYTKYMDSQQQILIEPPFTLPALFSKYPELLRHDDIHTGYQGIVVVDDVYMLAASRAVLTSLKEGPPKGTMIFLRTLDASQLEAFSQLTLKKLSLLPVAGPQASDAALPPPTELGQLIYVAPQDAQTISGYKYLQDLNGVPAFALKVDSERVLFEQGRIISAIFIGAFALLGFMLFASAYHFTLNLLNSRKLGRRYLQRFQTIVHQSNEAILLISNEGIILDANPSSYEMLRWEKGKQHGQSLHTLMDFVPPLDEARLAALSEKGGYSEHHCTRHDGLQLEIEVSASQISDQDVQAFSLILRDITARKYAEKALQASEERYMLAANGANDGVWDWNLTNDEVYYSSRWKHILGCHEEKLLPAPKTWFDRIHPDDLLTFQTLLSDHLRSRRGNFECEHRLMHKDGQYRWVLVRGLAVWNSSGRAHRIAGSLTDISNRKKLEDQLRYDALHDELTGLGNRTLLLEHLNHVNERKKRSPTLKFALLFLDFDRFKRINDTLGHAAGDQLLIEASQRMSSGLRATDTIARFPGTETVVRIAGDEFVILLEDVHSVEDVEKIAERVRLMLQTPYSINGHEFNISASIGVVIPENPYDNVENIIRDADIAMYRAKQGGGAQVVRFNQEMYQGTLARMQLENDLRKGVEREECEVYYQPIFSLDSDRIAGFEALVRWRHPEKGLLLPVDFISIAEETGMIIPIGYYVLEEACQKMTMWQKHLQISPDLTLSINLSARQILDTGLIAKIQAILRDTGFDPRRLWLEVTEDTLLENSEAVLARLNELRTLGISIEIDDFGTGYASLSYLQNLPIDGFKIDRSFIKDIQGGGQQIVKALVEMGHSLGLSEVAEGVETETQKDYLKTLSCKYMQGFLMSRPISANAIEEMLKGSQPEAAAQLDGEPAQ